MSWNYYGNSTLRGAGISYDTPSLDDLITQEETGYRAFCSSQWCAVTKARVQKDGVSQGQMECPDCKHALIWKRWKKK